MRAAALLACALLACAAASSDDGLVENAAVVPAARSRFRGASYVNPKLKIECKPEGDTLDKRDVEFQVSGSDVAVTVFRKSDPSKVKAKGKLVIPSGAKHVSQLLVPTDDELTEMVYKMSLKDAVLYKDGDKPTQVPSMTLELHLLADDYDSMAKALCPAVGGSCKDRAFVGALLRNMYQQLVVDNYRDGKGSCRGTAFVSGAFVWEDTADSDMCAQIKDAGVYTRASSHVIPGCTKPKVVGSCIAWGLELVENRMTALAEPITAAGQVRVWKGAVDVAKENLAPVRNPSNLRLSNHLLFNCFSVGAKNYVYAKPEEVGTLAEDKLTHGFNYLKTKIRDIGGGPEFSRQEAGEPDRFKLLKGVKALLDKEVPKAAEAGKYQVYSVLAEVKKAKAGAVPAVEKAIAEELGAAPDKVQALITREDHFAHRLGKEVAWTHEEAKKLWDMASKNADVAGIKVSSGCA